ncbi:MAG: lipoprotein signal peptidase [Gammaproteobacteria bacterium]|nr:lipoprotein signal peptidase [Gammaproteobacteria bacterium]
MKKENNLRWAGLSLFVLLMDGLSKYEVTQTFTLGQAKAMGPYLNLVFVYNRGTAFGLLSHSAVWAYWFLTVLALVVSVAIVVGLYQLPRNENWQGCGLAFVLGGALGNVWDRLTLGRVIDFIDFHIQSWHFATFNVADAAITVGAVMLLWKIVRGKVM